MKLEIFFSNYEFLPSEGSVDQLSIFSCGLWGRGEIINGDSIIKDLTDSKKADRIQIINGENYNGIFIFKNINTKNSNEIKDEACSILMELIRLGASIAFVTNELWVEDVIYGAEANDGCFILGYQVGARIEYGDIVNGEVKILNESSLNQFFIAKNDMNLVQL